MNELSDVNVMQFMNELSDVMQFMNELSDVNVMQFMNEL